MVATTKPSFLNLPRGGTLAYHRHTVEESKTGVLFLNGFRSSMDGNKAVKLQEFCSNQSHVSYTRFDYRGHGASSDRNNFECLGLSDWIADSKAMLENSCQAQGIPQILVGSSMGAWIALHLTMEQPRLVAGILGIAAAPNFTVDIEERLTQDQKEELQTNKRILLPSEYSKEPYPISQYLLDDAKKWLLLDRQPQSTEKHSPGTNTIDIGCPVRLIHGQEDIDVSWKKSLQLLDAIKSKDVHLTIVKSGDHRLSTPKELDTVCQNLADLIKVVV